MAQKLPFQKPLFEQKRPYKGPLNNFREVESYLFENCSQNGVKKHKKPYSKNLLLQVPQKDFTFFNFFAGFAPKIPKKQNCDIFKTKFSANLSI
jgi:hypothetical protein